MKTITRTICTLLAAACLSFAASALAQVPQILGYQGFLTNSQGQPINASMTMVFGIYQSTSGGSPLWSETQTVPVSNGIYNVSLGSVTQLSLPFDVPYYLGVTVGSDPEMTPRQALASAPYALSAARAGCAVGDFISCYTGVPSTMGVGPCKAGTRNCNPTTLTLGPCTGQVVPAKEIADGIDNDCDGVIDNGALANGVACGSAVTCASGFCVQGLCSNAACTGGCQSNLIVPGTCTTVPFGQDPRNACGSYVCNGSSANCPTSCTVSAQCKSGYGCVGGACIPSAPLGATCSVNSDCSSGFCTDGVCSNTACNGLCMKVNGAGICSFIAAGQDPDNECAAQPVSSCGTTGTCNGAGACQLYSSGTVCAAASCSGNVLNVADTCNGLGVCQDAGTQSCLPYTCDSGAGACYVSCASDTQCAAADYCNGTAQCVAKLSSGSGCSSNNQCVSGVCNGTLHCN